MTYDGRFSIEQVPCFGACDVSPAVRVNGVVQGEVNGKVTGTMNAIVDGNVQLTLLSGKILQEGQEDETHDET